MRRPRHALPAACLLLVLAGAARAQAISGAWVLKAHLPPGPDYQFLCAMDPKGAALSGQCVTVTDRVLPAAGRLADGKLSFHYTTDYNGSGLKLEFKGRLGADGHVDGAVQNRLGDGAFTGAPIFAGQTGGLSAWKFDVGFQGLRYILVCLFKPDGERVAGPCTATQGATARIRGEADATSLRFGLDSKLDGNPVHADFAGSAATGSISAGSRRGTYSLEEPGR